MCHTITKVACCKTCKTPRDKKTFKPTVDKTPCKDVEDGNDCKGETSETVDDPVNNCDACDSSSSDDGGSYNYGATPVKNPPK
jgi:hypothetical protein